MKKIDRRIVIIVSFLLIVGLAAGLMRFLILSKSAPPANRILESRRYVKAVVVRYGSVLSPVSEPGRMLSVSVVNLSAEASGKIIQGDIPLKKGATFEKGQVIFSIYSDEAALALKARKSQYLNTLALMLPDISIDFPDYEQAFRDFFSSINIALPLPEFPVVKDEKLNIFLASKNVPSEYYNIIKDELQLNRHVVRAPFKGTLSDVYQEVGAYINAGGSVARAIRTDELELEVPLNRFDADWVRVGDPVVVTSDYRSLQWKGKVIRKSQVIDENTQSQTVFVKVDNHAEKKLLAGEYLQAEFPGHPVEGVMEIPRNAVFNSNDVFVVKNGRLQNRVINIVKINTKTLLFNGITEGDTLVVQPLINVYEGTQVTTSLDKIIPERTGSSPDQPEQGKKKKKDREKTGEDREKSNQ